MLTVICKAGTVVSVPFPFVDSNQTKHRPALVLSSKEFNNSHGHSVMVMITSAKHSGWPTDIAISDLKNAGLNSPSIIRFKVFTLDNQLIIGILGRIVGDDWKVSQKTLNNILF